MNILFNNDIDQNNNTAKLLDLKNSNQENMEVSPFDEIEENLSQKNSGNRSQVSEINEEIFNNMNVSISDGQENSDPKEENINLLPHESSLVNKIDKNETINNEPITSNYGSSNTRKSRKKKRHYNINKNKKNNQDFLLAFVCLFVCYCYCLVFGSYRIT